MGHYHMHITDSETQYHTEKCHYWCCGSETQTALTVQACMCFCVFGALIHIIQFQYLGEPPQLCEPPGLINLLKSTGLYLFSIPPERRVSESPTSKRERERERDRLRKDMVRGERRQHTGRESFVLHQPSIPLSLHLIKDGQVINRREAVEGDQDQKSMALFSSACQR